MSGRLTPAPAAPAPRAPLALRLATCGMLALCGLPLVQAARTSSDDPLRATVLGLCAALGVGLNLLGLAGRDAGLTRALRLLATGVALFAAGAALWMALHLRGVLADLPADAVALRSGWETVRVNLYWLAATMPLLTLSVWLLPWKTPAARPLKNP